ncbi:hypothetical protein K438DRAFT_1808781 [Mycena galopus ATCC 62051]|nr:hypothetical protein K438DRAFT_1808781 [Mycena galopus ATCC 62051]
MPTLIQSYPFKSSAFLHLPQELLDEIISDLEHKDLVSLALVSRASCVLVIPRHTEYRILRVRHLLPAMWAHLARRADLTRNIREVHICERFNKSASDHAPKTLIDHCVDEKITHVVEERRVRNICTALGYMHRLHTFTWSWEVDPPSNAILEVLSRKKTLRHVGLSGMFGGHAPGVILQPDVFILRGNAWIKPTNAPHLKRMLKIPMEFSGLVDCKFPYLKRLNLFLQSGGIRSIDPRVVRFLSDHQASRISPGSRSGPLKRIRTNVQVVEMLDCAIESLDIYQLDPATLVRLKNLQYGSVRKVKLHAFGDLDSMYELAELLDDWLDLLPRLWAAVTLNMQRMHGVIMQLLDHSGHNQARQDWNRITIVREGPEGENVRYRIDRPPAKRWFDALEGAFD